MLKKFLIAIAGFVVVVIILVAVKASQIKQLSSMSHVPPPTAVTTYVAKSVAWQPMINAIGSLAPVEGVTLAPDADGTIVKIAADSGAAVKAGDLIVELDTTVEQAQLAAAQARLELAKLQRARAAELAAKNTISASEQDTAIAELNQATADVAAIQATIDKKHVRAPFDGRVGIRLVNLGQFVARGRALVPLQKLDPVYVNFTVPQRQLGSLVLGQPVIVHTDSVPVPYRGTITAINSEVDAETRNVSVQALLANPEEHLRAGMFVQVEVELPQGPPLVVVPATAISYAPYGNSVFIVENLKGPDGVEYLGVRQQIVRVGTARGDLVAIELGVQPGEQVVTGGVFKLRNGAHVEVNNTVQPTANPTPKPANT